LERDEYEKLEAVEDRMWWFDGLRANLAAALRRGAPATPGVPLLLDAGCGTGGLLVHLRRECPGWRAVGLDADPAACAAARRKSGGDICRGSANALPFANGSFAAIFGADLLCHREVDEERTLAGFHRCLAAGGLLVLNLPAYGWLLSGHDRAVHNARRYTRRRLSHMLRAAGFSTVRTTYWNTLLFPLMVIRRGLSRGNAATSDVMPYPAPVETAFRRVLKLERRLLERGIALPFGGSVLATAVKP